MIFALAAPALIGAIGLSVDYVMITDKYSKLQAVADAAAVGSASELPLANFDGALVTAVAEQFVKSNTASITAKSRSTISTNVEIVDKFTGVRVTLKEAWTPIFAQFLTDKATPIVVTAKANILGEGLICVVGLMPRKDRAGIHMDDNASIDAQDCGIYSNSSNPYAIRMDKNSSIKARLVCSVGGFGSFGSGTSISPVPVTDCPPINDPLAKRQPPTVGGCDYNGLEIGQGVEVPAASRS
ncbi:MAG TPA: hypothetical protein ENJ55_02430, partial [Rhizobiales bacterium]|nr:hypothetical protein [Hyphomicrobiales bacterium]